MNKNLIIIVLFISFLTFMGCSINKHSPGNVLVEYKNKELGISLKYPSNWKVDKKSILIGNIPSHFSGNTGFFAINVLSSNNKDLEAIVKIEAEKGDYGETPKIEKIVQNAKIGYFIIPSPDQSEEEKQRSCFITDLQNSYTNGDDDFDILILFVDQQHIKDLIESLEYL